MPTSNAYLCSCPGAAIYLFEVAKANDVLRILHTGDFRACSDHLTHPTLLRNGKLIDIDILYLDTTYCKPEHVFPSQKDVIDVVVDVAERFVLNKEPMQAITNKNTLFSFLKFPEKKKQKVCTDTVAGWLNLPDPNSISDTLVVVGTYLIGKEKIFISVAQALKSKIWADSNKRRIYKSQDNSILNDLLVTDPHKANVHILPLTKLDKPVICTYRDSAGAFVKVSAFQTHPWYQTNRLDLWKGIHWLIYQVLDQCEIS